MAELNSRYYDLIIIGGGINGAACARDAVLRGFSVCLFEKNTMGSGTSSRSSKLAHGGLRYLENFEFRMVQETLHERDLLLKLAPHYVKPLPFIYPVYDFSSRPLWKVKIGMWLYQFLAKSLIVPGYQLLSNETIKQYCPALSQKGLKGGALYYDAQLQDQALVVANMNDARSLGVDVYEQAKVIGFIKESGKVQGVKVRIKEGIYEVFARQILNTSGPWMNEISRLDDESLKPLVAPTKGSHIVVKNFGLNYALTLESPIDKRIFFMLPWQNQVLIGTTDTAFNGDPDRVEPSSEEVNYLLQSANGYLNAVILTEADIIGRFAGLRPLAYSQKGESSRSRDFSITQSNSGLIHLFGGKYTSYRLMAEETIDYIVSRFSDQSKFLPCTTHQRELL
jgi:glycerol-3-phosphate dehydrogenase